MRLPFEQMPPVRLRWFDSYCRNLPEKHVADVYEMIKESVVVSCGPDGVRHGRDDPARYDRWWRLRAGLPGPGWTDAVLAHPRLLPDEEAALGFRRGRKVDTAVSTRWPLRVLHKARFCLAWTEWGHGAVLGFTVHRLAGALALMARTDDVYGLVPRDKAGVPVVRVFFKDFPPMQCMVGGRSHLVPREVYGYVDTTDPEDETGIVRHPQKVEQI